MSGWIPDAALMTPEPMPLAVLYEDADLLVVDKPAGMVVHPAYRHLSGTLLNGILWYGRAWPRGSRPSIVGRLDKMTSGIVVVAKRAAMHRELQRALGAPDASKEYLALVAGAVDVGRGAIDLPLRRDPANRTRVVVAADGARSMTRFTCAASGPSVSLLRCRLVTGRMHQIRAHLAARGWPIVGDPIYGPRAGTAPSFPRQALHAHRVALTHPVTGERLQMQAPVPEDMRALLSVCGLSVPER